MDKAIEQAGQGQEERNDDGDNKSILGESELINKLGNINIFRVYVARGYEDIEPEIKTIINKVKKIY